MMWNDLAVLGWQLGGVAILGGALVAAFTFAVWLVREAPWAMFALAVLIGLYVWRLIDPLGFYTLVYAVLVR